MYHSLRSFKSKREKKKSSERRDLEEILNTSDIFFLFACLVYFNKSDIARQKLNRCTRINGKHPLEF